ncbi:MAG TPA: AlpA family phage regulatory protein [Allosphingosinicella sp.]|jgi:prophage regulatory protein
MTAQPHADPSGPPALAGSGDVRSRNLARRGEVQAVLDDPYLTRAQVEAETGFSRATLFRRIKSGTFPPGKDVGNGQRRWPRCRIEAWKSKGAAWREALPADHHL